MKDLNELHSLVIDILPAGSTFEIDTGEQSFVTVPTNHINLTNGEYSINIGHIVYGNITVYDEMIDHLQDVYNACESASGELGDYVQVVYLSGQDQPFRAVFGGLGEYSQVMEDFATVEELLHCLKTFEFEDQLSQEN